MSTMINLLPDLRQAKLRDLRRRQLAVGVSISIWVVCAAVVGILSIYTAGQKVVISTLSGQIDTQKKALEGIDGLTDALTADQHLASLTDLYSKRVYITKFFKGYTAASPVSTSIDTLTIDAQNTLKVNGKSPSYAEVAKLARALALVNVTIGEGATATSTPYFTDVAIGGVQADDKGVVTFSITATMTTGATDGTK